MTADFTLAFITHEVAPPPLVTVIRRFPWPGCSASDKAAPNCPELAPGAQTMTAHIPSTWASMLLSESFWIDPRYPKSHNFFHRNSIFVSQTPNGSSAEEAKPQALPPGYRYPHDMLALKDWNERQRLWDEHRQGWFAENKEKVCDLLRFPS